VREVIDPGDGGKHGQRQGHRPQPVAAYGENHRRQHHDDADRDRFTEPAQDRGDLVEAPPLMQQDMALDAAVGADDSATVQQIGGEAGQAERREQRGEPQQHCPA
jgi:hypothetical protein